MSDSAGMEPGDKELRPAIDEPTPGTGSA